MRSKELHLEKYDSDKISSLYMDRYDLVLQPWISKPIVLLELGVYKAGSLMLWHDYFPLGTIIGIDVKLPEDFISTDRIHMFEGNQTNRRFLSSVANEVAPAGFDIIIDDASHIGLWTKIAFWHLFDNHLKPGGLYVIEDWGTGYWDDWPDGKSFDLQMYAPPESKFKSLLLKLTIKLRLKIPLRCHSYGMVGFVKQLIDEQGAHDASRARLRDKPKRKSKFKEMLVTPGMIFIKKADLESDAGQSPA